MQVNLLEKYLPPNALPILKNWFGDYIIHIKITNERSSKLGDYQKVGDNKFIITINHNLQPELFFFVFTHEMAHLFAFEKFGRRKIAPHGKEWKDTFRRLLVETISIYSEDDEVFVEQLQLGEIFWFRETKYRMETRRRKNYLCSKVSTGQEYIFRPLIKVKKTIDDGLEIVVDKISKIIVSDEVFVNQLKPGDFFLFENIRFQLEKKRRINYLCKDEKSGKSYVFPPLIKVKIIS